MCNIYSTCIYNMWKWFSLKGFLRYNCMSKTGVRLQAGFVSFFLMEEGGVWVSAHQDVLVSSSLKKEPCGRAFFFFIISFKNGLWLRIFWYFFILKTCLFCCVFVFQRSMTTVSGLNSFLTGCVYYSWTWACLCVRASDLLFMTPPPPVTTRMWDYSPWVRTQVPQTYYCSTL